MTRKKRMTDLLSQYRGAIDADDGADPREFFKQEGFADRTGRKSHQLCAQVADTLSQIFGGECGDDVLQSLTVIDVAPAPDASQLLVQLGPITPEIQLTTAEVSAALDRAAGWLRTEVAAAITRKRAPRLVFRFVPRLPESTNSPESEVQP
ncbi:MAG: ribosome-binding factor A [Planctomycetaceae bacterium]|nr:ribosome-binding factor A [Planctomycetaceae bacterium]